MFDTWYVLEDGRSADPQYVAPDADGVLKYKDGVRVAIGPHGPRSRGVDVVAERARAAEAERRLREAAAADDAAPSQDRQMTAKAGGARYKTR